MANQLEGKVAAVTGGDQGIGRAIVERLAQEGAEIALCYRANKAGADGKARTARSSGTRSSTSAPWRTRRTRSLREQREPHIGDGA